MAIASINPATGETLRTFEPYSEAEIERRLEKAFCTFKEYRRMPLAPRAARMLRAAEILEREKDRFVRLITAEMGKLVFFFKQKTAYEMEL